MPLFIFRNTRCGACVLCAASQSICASWCTTCHRFRREHSSRSRGSKQPSSSRIGPRQSSARSAFGLVQVEQRKAVGAAQPGEGALDAVAVGIGLDHRPDPRIRRGLARARQVVRQRVGVDQRFDRTRHCNSLRAGARAFCQRARRRIRAAGRAGGACYKPLPLTGDKRAPLATALRDNDALRMKKGFSTIMSAQFFSSLADNALLVAAIELLNASKAPTWHVAALPSMFALFYVLLAPFVGAFADAVPKGKVMFVSNTIKVVGCLMMMFGTHPLLSYAIVGLGAAAYSPAKYGILTELLPPSQLVKANGWIEGLTILSVILGIVLGGQLVGPPCRPACCSAWTCR